MIRTTRAVCALLLAIPLLGHATPMPLSHDLILTAPPRETPAAAKKLYGPLATELTQLVGRKVVYEYPGLYLGDWSSYTHRMQEGKFDFIFDGPQFAAWRMKYLHNVPLVRLPGELSYVVASDNPSVHGLTDLVGETVCGIDSPNLLTLSMLSKFPPMEQPQIKAIDSGGMKAIYQAQMAGACSNAIYRSSFYLHHLTASQRARLHVIYRSQLDLPNQTLTAGPRVPAAARARIIEALITPQGSRPDLPILRRFAKGATHFVAANPASYQSLTNLLTPLGTVSGWVPESSKRSG